MILRRRHFYTAAAFVAALSLLAALGATDFAGRSEAVHGGMETMSIDMNPAGNSSGAVGSIDTCARINKNSTQDADEDFIDGLFIDITAKGVPAYNNNGTPSDPSDDSGGITGYQYTFDYPGQFTVAAQQTQDGLVNLLAANNANPATSILNASEPVPDDEASNFNTWDSVVLDYGTETPESGEGVLDRLTILADAPTAGQYLVTLSNNGHSDASSGIYQPHSTALANIAIGQPCGTLITSLGYFHPVTPYRILDTRTGPQGVPAGIVDSGEVISVDVTAVGASGVPASGVSAVVVNTTVTGATAGSYLTVYPSGVAQPLAASLNFGSGQTIANLVTVKAGADGNVKVFNAAGQTHVIFDIVGWYGGSTGGSRYNPLTPARILDTRTGLGAPAGKVGTNSEITVDVTGFGGVPASPSVSAVVVNTTVTEPTAGSYLTVYPSGVTRPVAANLNFGPGQTIANLVTVKVGADGNVKVYNCCGQTHVIFDVVGWYGTSSGDVLNPLTPARILDTRTGPQGVPAGKVQSNAEITVDVTGVPGSGVPTSGVSSVIVNTTVTEPTAGSYLTVFPSDVTRPLAANLNFGPGQTIPNLVIVKVGADGNVKVYNCCGQVHVIFDVVGYFAPVP